nr:hypothetical protein [Gimesia benthica]
MLDEPTNDLDAETLELLEELICNHPATLLLVSHDRAFLNNVVTATLVVDEDGSVKEYAGGYDDYLRQSENSKAVEEKKPESKNQPVASPEKPKPKAKLSYKEERELEQIPQQIEALEQEQTELQSAMSDPDFFKQSNDVITDASNRLQTIQSELERLLERWEELESRVQ